MATMSTLFRRILRRSLKPRNSTIRRKASPLGQAMEQFELELRWVPAILTPLPGTGTISALTVNPGDTIQLANGTYFDFVRIDDANVQLLGAIGGNSTIAAPYNDVTESLGFSANFPTGNGSGHLVSVIASNVTVANITFNGNGKLFSGAATSTVNIGTTPIWANKGVTNSLSPGYFDGNDVYHSNATSISCLTVSNCTFLNLGGDAISLTNTAIDSTLTLNKISRFGAEGSSYPWAGIWLGDNSMANVTYNNITITGENYGIAVDNNAGSPAGNISNNTVSVGQSGIGITINLTYGTAGAITIANNVVTANGTTPSSPAKTRGINLYSIYNGAVTLTNNTVNGTAGGRFDIGVDVWNVGPNVSINGGSVGNAAVGMQVDGVDPYWGATPPSNPTNLVVQNTTISGSIGLQVTNSNQTLPPAQVSAGYTGIPLTNVLVTLANGSVASTAVGGNAISISSNSNATYEARVVADGNLAISGLVAKLGGTSNQSIFQDNRSARFYDFGTGTTLAPGSLAVPPGAIYSLAQGYGFNTTLSGWNVPGVALQDGVRGGALANGAANGCFSPSPAAANFTVNLAAGSYSVKAYVGSKVPYGGTFKSTTIDAYVGGSIVSTYSANTSSSFANGTLSSVITLLTPTQVDFRMSSPNGYNWAVNGLQIDKVPSPLPNLKLDFNATGPTQATFTGLNTSAATQLFTPGLGNYGWASAISGAIDRGSANTAPLTDLFRDFAYGLPGSGNAVYQVGVLPGATGNVTVYAGDQLGGTPSNDWNFDVIVEGGGTQNVHLTGPIGDTSNFKTLNFTGTDLNSDGVLNITFAPLAYGGGPSSAWVLNGLVLS